MDPQVYLKSTPKMICNDEQLEVHSEQFIKVPLSA